MQNLNISRLPPREKPIGCKWIFKRKYHPDGSINKYIARLVKKGFSPKENIGNFDTFAPVLIHLFTNLLYIKWM